jgi:hypothetical protein
MIPEPASQKPMPYLQTDSLVRHAQHNAVDVLGRRGPQETVHFTVGLLCGLEIRLMMQSEAHILDS